MAGDTKVGRNDRCPCGSGRKYKHCCERKKSRMSPASWAAVVCIAVAAAFLVFFLFNLTQSSGRASIGPCPPGQTWSAEHGHCH